MKIVAFSSVEPRGTSAVYINADAIAAFGILDGSDGNRTWIRLIGGSDLHVAEDATTVLQWLE